MILSHCKTIHSLYFQDTFCVRNKTVTKIKKILLCYSEEDFVRQPRIFPHYFRVPLSLTFIIIIFLLFCINRKHEPSSQIHLRRVIAAPSTAHIVHSSKDILVFLSPEHTTDTSTENPLPAHGKACQDSPWEARRSSYPRNKCRGSTKGVPGERSRFRNTGYQGDVTGANIPWETLVITVVISSFLSAEPLMFLEYHVHSDPHVFSMHQPYAFLSRHLLETPHL